MIKVLSSLKEGTLIILRPWRYYI